MKKQNISPPSIRSALVGGNTDWDAVDRLTDAEIVASVAEDPDAAPIADDAWFAKARVRFPDKEAISIRLDADVLTFFRAQGPRYQSRINEVLKAYVEHVQAGDRGE